MIRDNRDPTLVAVELRARRKPGEPLSRAADRLANVEVPDHGTPEAAEAFRRLNGSVEAATAAFGR